MQWFALPSKPNREESLWREVGARGHEDFYPRLRAQPVNPRSWTMLPYFPDCLFVRMCLADVGRSMFAWLPFGQGLVSFGKVPANVPEALVGAVHRRVDEINAVGSEQLVGLVPGDPAINHGGPSHSYQASFDARDAGSERVRLLLKLLDRRMVRLDLPVGQIEQINLH